MDNVRNELLRNIAEMETSVEPLPKASTKEYEEMQAPCLTPESPNHMTTSSSSNLINHIANSPKKLVVQAMVTQQLHKEDLEDPEAPPTNTTTQLPSTGNDSEKEIISLVLDKSTKSHNADAYDGTQLEAQTFILKK